MPSGRSSHPKHLTLPWVNTFLGWVTPVRSKVPSNFRTFVFLLFCSSALFLICHSPFCFFYFSSDTKPLYLNKKTNKQKKNIHSLKSSSLSHQLRPFEDTWEFFQTWHFPEARCEGDVLVLGYEIWVNFTGLLILSGWYGQLLGSNVDGASVSSSVMSILSREGLPSIYSCSQLYLYFG